jgi:hypothetical protein
MYAGLCVGRKCIFIFGIAHKYKDINSHFNNVNALNILSEGRAKSEDI